MKPASAETSEVSEVTGASTAEGQPRVFDDPQTTEVLRLHVEEGKNLATILNSQAAEEAGASVKWFGTRTAVATFKDKAVLLDGYISDQGWVSCKIADDKWLTKRFLESAGVSTPRARKCDSVEDALAFKAELSRNVVVKPLGAMGGKGVTVNLESEDDIRDAYKRAEKYGASGVLAEEYIDGDLEYRCLATPTKCVSVVQRLLPNVTGDGKSTIRELIEEKNTSRRLNPALIDRYIPLDSVTERYLASQTLSLDTVLSKGQRQVVRDVGGLSSGGEPVECFDSVDPAVREVAVAANAAIPGLTWGGSDILVERSTGIPWVIEINPAPDIMGSTYPLYGRPQNVAAAKWIQRVTSARPQPKTAVPRPSESDKGKSVFSDFPNIWTNLGEARLSRLLKHSLTANGYEVSQEGPSVLSVKDDDGREMWFTTDFLGVRDPVAVRRVLKQSSTVRRLLVEAQVPRVSGRRVASIHSAEVFAKAHGGPYAIVPQNREWGSLAAWHALTPEGIRKRLARKDGPWLIQTVPAGGERVTAIATQERLLWAVGSADLANTISTTGLQELADLAVKACRSIPELRWGAVEINFREGRELNRRKSWGLVEGVTLNPKLRRGHFTIAGSFNAVLDKIKRM